MPTTPTHFFFGICSHYVGANTFIFLDVFVGCCFSADDAGVWWWGLSGYSLERTILKTKVNINYRGQHGPI